jgi:hypothetical protein
MVDLRLRPSCVLLSLLTLVVTPVAANAQLVTAPGAGVSPLVRVIETNGTERSFHAYHPAFTGGVRVALGDVTGDGILDIVTAPGPGGGPHVRVWDGVTLTEVGGFFAYDPAFPGGVWVAAGDVDGDGRADIITGAGAGGGPHVRVWSGADFHEIGGFFAYHPAFPGGVAVAAGDVNGDGRADIITGAGPGGGPHVRVWNATNFSEIGGFFAYNPAFGGGVFVAAGDVNNDGRADIITGAGPGGGPHVRVWNATDFVEIGGFFATDPAFSGGVNVGAIDLTGDGRAEVITGLGPGGLPISSIFNGADLGLLGSYFAFDPSLRVGVFVGSVGKSSALRFTSASTTAFTRNQAGTFTVTTAGGATVPTLTVTGALPAGVTFTDNGDRTATLAGTPTVSGTFPLTFTANNGSGTPVTQTFTLTVNQAPAITSANSATFNIGSVGSTFTVTTTGSPTPAISVTGALPSGIMFTDNNNGTATIAGTPAAGTSGAYPLVITASNGVGTAATQNFTLTINSGAAITSANATTFTVGAAGTFTVTTTGAPTATTITASGTLPTGVTFTNNGNGTATLAGTPGAGTGGTYSLTITASNGVGSPATQSFTLTVNQAPAITSAASTTFTVGSAGTFTITSTGFPAPAITSASALPGGVTLTDNGNGTATLAGTPGAGTGGTYPLTISASNGIGTAASQSFTLTVNQAPAITSANATTFVVGQAGTFTVTTTGFPTPVLTRGGVALPSGVTFVDNGNGTATLAGTPGAGTGGSYAITFTATNAAGAPVQPFTLTVNQAPAITSAASTTFIVGQAGTFTITTTGFPAASIGSAGSLPAGVTFTNNGDGTATLAGTPDPGTGGTYPLTITATNVAGSATPQSFTVTVNQPAAVTSANATTFVVGQAGSFTITTSGVPAVTAITRGGVALPSGVTFTDNGDGTGTLSGTPGAGTGGSYAISFTATNGVGAPAVQPFTLTVNQAPAITSANNTTFTVGQAGSFTVTTTGFPAASIARGGAALPAGVTFVDNSNGTGTLSGTPGAGTGGGYALTFTATNVAGSSPVQNFTLTAACPVISVTPPSSVLTAATYLQAYSQTFGATGSTGITFSVGAGTLPPGLTLGSNGVLAGTPSNTGTFVFDVTGTDAFACTGSTSYSLTVRPNAVDETYSGGVGNTQLVVAPAPFSATPAVIIVGSVLSNDVGPGGLTAGPGSITSANGGSIALGANGAFVYTPAIGFAGPSDTFVYTLLDGNGGTDTATVTINLSGRVWYVNNSGANGDGRSHSPFNNLNNAQTPSNPGDVIFVHAGTGTTPGAIALKTSQTLWGNGQFFALNSLSIGAAGTPVLGGTVTLANDVIVRAVDISSGASSAIVGTGLTGTETIDSVNVTGGATGFNLTNVGGTFNVVNSSVANVTGTDVRINGGDGTLSIGAAITNTAGRSVHVDNRSGGSVGFTRPISDTGQGIFLTNNSNGTVLFLGGLTLNTGANDAFTATNGGGRVSAQQDNATIVNTITTTTGTAVNVTNYGIGTVGLTFRSISANGAVNGIVLNNTGTGTLTVTGNSSGNCGGSVTVNAVGTPATVGAPMMADCTGGTIQNSTGHGISLTNTVSTSLTRMLVLNSGLDGISLSGVDGFTLARSVITDGSGVAGDRGIEMGDFSTGTAVNGTISISNSTVGPTPHDNFGVGIASGTSSWSITNTVFTGSTLNSGFNFEIRNATLSSFTMDGCVLQNQFADGMQMQPAGGVSATITAATIQNSTFQSNNIGMDLNHDGTSNVTYRVLNNTFMNQASNSINFFSSASVGTGGSLNGRFVGNVIGNAAVFNSGGGIGVRININGGADSSVLVDSNTIRQVPNGRGIEIISRNGTGGTDATVTNNQVDTDFVPTVANGGFSLSNIFLQSNCVTVCNTLRADVRLNTVPAVAPTGELIAAQLALIETGASTLQLVDTGAASASCTAQLTETNTGSASASAGCTLIPGPINVPF